MVMKPEGQGEGLSALLWFYELMNWLSQRLVVHMLVQVTSRSLRVIMPKDHLFPKVYSDLPHGCQSLHTFPRHCSPLPHPGPMGVLV